MGKPILYGNFLKSRVRTVLLTAAAIGVDLEFREIDILKKQHLTPEYLKKNPQHTVPTLEVDGKFLCDSHAIVAYLVEKYGKDDSLYPKDLFERGLVDQRLHFDSGTLYPILHSLCSKFFKNEVNEAPRPTDKINDTYKAYDVLEKFLNGTDYVAANNLTIADFSCMATVSSLRYMAELSAEKYPNILAWIKRMESLPYYTEKCGEGARLLDQILRAEYFSLIALMRR